MEVKINPSLCKQINRTRLNILTFGHAYVGSEWHGSIISPSHSKIHYFPHGGGAIKWANDGTVFGLATAFLVIWMQQSVEIGLVSAEPNIIPYMILGLLYARINTLESEKDDEAIYNNTGV